MSIAEAGIGAQPVPTPCINVCRLDETTGLCLGCARNGAEIAAWVEADAGFKQSVWAALPPRRAGLAMRAYRLPWTAAEIGAFVEATVRGRSGRWTLGAFGASVSFAVGDGEAAEITSTPEAVTAVTRRGAVRLLKHEKTIAIAFGNAAVPDRPEAIGLVLPRGRVALPSGTRIDEQAICPEHRGHTLWPFPIDGGLAVRISARSPDGAGFGVPDAPSFGAGSDIVAETGLGRAEIFGGHDGDDRTVELDPARLGEVRELPPAFALDRVFVLGALFYPRPPLSEGA